MKYSPEFIAKLKAAVDIAAFIGETVVLRRSGKDLVGLSPFTKEKTPSFRVHPDKQSFYCFSTSQGGDIFTYLEKTRGMSFTDAVAFVAERAGIELEQSNRTPEQIKQDRERSEKKKAALKLNKFAARFYQETLEGPLGAPARDYVKKRAITPEALLGFAIGFAPDSWTALRDFFLQIKAPMLQAYELGLFRTKGGEPPRADGSNMFDTYRNRLMFPIRDPQGEVIGFGGRWLGASNAEAPKYVNSSESPLYEKDKVLYNLDQAKPSIRELETVVIVEGYMDCLALYQAGFTNVVANCGTALTRTQVGMLRKLAPKVICLYDSDKAGQAAMEKAMDLFLDAEGLPLLGAHLPDGKDPDEFLKAHGDEGTLRMAEILQNSPALLDEWIAKTIAETPKSLQGRTDALNKIASKLAKLRDDLSIQARFPVIEKGLEVERDLLIASLRKFKKGFLPDFESKPAPGGTVRATKSVPQPRAPIPQKSGRNQGGSGKRDIGFQRRFLSDLLKNPTWLESLRKMPPQDRAGVLKPVDDPSVMEALSKILEPLSPGETDGERIGGLLDTFRDQPELRDLVAGSASEPEVGFPPKDLESSLSRLREEGLRKLEAEAREELAAAEKAGDTQAADAALAKLTDVRRQRAQR
jgi:DNA primase catalytic core